MLQLITCARDAGALTALCVAAAAAAAATAAAAAAVQRRRNAEDELNMRSMFREGDLISVSCYDCISSASSDVLCSEVKCSARRVVLECSVVLSSSFGSGAGISRRETSSA
jgi:hypothetical protein